MFKLEQFSVPVSLMIAFLIIAAKRNRSLKKTFTLSNFCLKFVYPSFYVKKTHKNKNQHSPKLKLQTSLQVQLQLSFIQRTGSFCFSALSCNYLQVSHLERFLYQCSTYFLVRLTNHKLQHNSQFKISL